MNRIEAIFAGQRKEGRKGLMPFVCGGYPEAGVTGRALWELERAGASVVEVGIPFSDPIADGPVIAAAMHEAIQRGATWEGVLDEVRGYREGGGGVGVVAMVSVSIVWRCGATRFVEAAKSAGVDGFIFPDLPVEECGDLGAVVRGAGMTMSLLVAPTTAPERAELICRASSGFVYLMARTGITGESEGSIEIGDRVGMLRGCTGLPIACGFGIGSAEQVGEVVRHADAAIVGSAFVRRMGEAARVGEDSAEAAGRFCGELSRGLGTV